MENTIETAMNAWKTDAEKIYRRQGYVLGGENVYDDRGYCQEWSVGAIG